MEEVLTQKVLSSNHHKHVLSEMFKFVHLECLTDLTFICQNGSSVHAHRKVLTDMSPLLRKIANSRPKEDRLFIITDDIPKEVLVNFLCLTYKGEVKNLSEQEITEVNQVCQILEVDITATNINKAKPKASPARKKNVTLGKTVKESPEILEIDETEPEPEPEPEPETSTNNHTNNIAKKSEKKRRVVHQEPKAASSSAERNPRPSASKDAIKLYCLCREPERPGMIGCDYCEEWYHISCLNLKKEDAKQLTKCKWQCPKCELESKRQEKNKIQVGQGTEKPRRNARKISIPTKRSSSTLSSSSSSSSASSSSSSDSSSDSDSSDSNAPEPTLKKPKVPARNGIKAGVVGRKTSADELHFCYICKSIFISQSAKEAHDKERHSKG